MNNIGTPDRDGYYFQTSNERLWFGSLKDAKAAAQAVADASDCSMRIWHGLTSKTTIHPAGQTPYERAMAAINRGLAAEASAPSDWRNGI